ncbi:MAG TPA: hypothetical protein VM327_04325, partial [Candidatus Thermoplasmatota archaeon]|nr:hypothetical protein [Candidatus Thermoplasmatota archaeon]
MQNYTNKALGLFVVSLLALAAVSTVSAQATGGFGRVVTASTADSTYVLNAFAVTPLLCYIDTD